MGRDPVGFQRTRPGWLPTEAIRLGSSGRDPVGFQWTPPGGLFA